MVTFMFSRSVQLLAGVMLTLGLAASAARAQEPMVEKIQLSLFFR
jgi:hypothetical protein